MTDSITFHEHVDFGTMIELRGNVHYLEGRLCISIKEMQEMLRIYNGHYKKQVRRQRDKAVYRGRAESAAPACTLDGG